MCVDKIKYRIEFFTVMEFDLGRIYYVGKFFGFFYGLFVVLGFGEDFLLVSVLVWRILGRVFCLVVFCFV